MQVTTSLECRAAWVDHGLLKIARHQPTQLSPRHLTCSL